MPASPVSIMRARARQTPQRLTQEEKDRRREERDRKKSAVPAWLVWLMMFIVVGSIFVQMYFSVMYSPKMAD